MSLLDRPRAAALAARTGWVTGGEPNRRGIPPTHVPLTTMDTREMMRLHRKELGSGALGSVFGGAAGALSNLYRTGPSRLRTLANSYGGTQDSVVWVFACTSLISSTLASYPWHLEDDDEETVERPPDDLLALLRKPNPKTTWFDLMETLATDLELVGNGYALKDQRRPLDGKPLALYRLRPDRVRIATNPDGTIRGYVYTPQDGFAIPYEEDEVIHFKYPNPLDDYYGMGTVEAIASVLDQISAEALHVTGFFQNGARISGVLSIPATLTDTQFERLKSSYLENYAGPANAYKMLIAEGGGDYKPVTTTPAAGGVVDLMKVGKDEALSAFGIPAPLLGGILENANYKMDESQHIFTRAMIPRTRRISERLSFELIYPIWGLTLAIDAHANEPLDVRLAHGEATMKAGGSVAEGREAAGLPVSDHPDAKKILVPANLIPLELSGAPPRPGGSIPMDNNQEAGAAPGATMADPGGEASMLPQPGSPPGGEAPTEVAPAKPPLSAQLGDLPDAIRNPKAIEDVVARAIRAERAKAQALRRGFSDFEAKEAGNTGAMVALYPSASLASDAALDGGLDVADLHVTLAFLGEAADLDDADALRAAVRGWAGETPPLSGEVSGVGLFTAGPEPVTYLSVDCPGLPAAREALVSALEAAGAPASDDHGFTPHMTLDYDDRTGEVDAALGGRAVRFASVALVIGEDREDFDLTGEAPKAARSSALSAVDGMRAAWGGRKRPSGASSAALPPSEPEAEGYVAPELPRGFEALGASTKGRPRKEIREWRAHQARTLRVGVDTFEPQMRRYFKAQRDRVLQALSEYGGGQRSARLRAETTKAKGDLTADGIFSLSAENAALRESYLPALDKVAEVAADTPPEVVAAVSWDVTNPRVADVRDQMAELVVRVNDTTRGAIASAVETGLQRGYSIPQIANGFPDENYPGVMGVFDEADSVRAETIARSESAMTLNRASSVAYRGAGVELLEILDGEGDEICAAANGAVWTVDDYDANPIGHPNCARTAVPAPPGTTADDAEAPDE